MQTAKEVLTRRVPRRRGLAFLAVVVLALAACGNDTGEADPADEPDSEAAGSGEADESDPDEADDAGPDDGEETSPELAWAQANIPDLDPELVEAACDEGELSLYHVVYRDELQTLMDSFQSAFPCITVVPFGATGGALAERFTTEARAGQNDADVWMNTTPGLATELAEEGILASYTPPNADNIPDTWKDDGLWYGVGLAHIAVAWNESQVTDEQRAAIESIETWEDIVQPAMAGVAGIANIRAGGTAQLPMYFLHEQYGVEFWEEMSETLRPLIFDGGGPTADRLAAGEIVFMPHASGDNPIAGRYLDGAPLRWRFPEPGLAIAHFITIAEEAPNPNAARLFTAWSLSYEGQAAWVADTNLAPMSGDVVDAREFAQEDWYGLPESYYESDWETITDALPELYELFDDIFEQ